MSDTDYQPKFGHAPHEPLQALLDADDDAVLAVIAATEGPSYRPVGAMMAVLSPQNRVGSLSSGCIENDIALHAQDVIGDGIPKLLRYGKGSPFKDIELPCGGGLDIVLLPNPNREAIAEVVRNQVQRVTCTLEVDIKDGEMQILRNGKIGLNDSKLRVQFKPEIQFLTFGKGSEASTFSALVQSTGYPNILLSQDPETLKTVRDLGCSTRQLLSQSMPDNLQIDERTAIVLFFHDHDWEPPILHRALKSKAFYIGAQGSMRARDNRVLCLSSMGISPDDIKKLHGPIGLIPSARDPRNLAVSVLAEVLAKASGSLA